MENENYESTKPKGNIKVFLIVAISCFVIAVVLFVYAFILAPLLGFKTDTYQQTSSTQDAQKPDGSSLPTNSTADAKDEPTETKPDAAAVAKPEILKVMPIAKDGGSGYVIFLKQDATVSSVKYTSNSSGGVYELRATSPATPTSGPVLVTSALKTSGQIFLKQPTITNTLVLWFTKAPTVPEGEQLKIENVQVIQ
jgi:hypothetical protein